MLARRSSRSAETSSSNSLEQHEVAQTISAPSPDEIRPTVRTVQKDDNCAGRLAAPAPFDSDDVAVQERDSIDYGVKITAEMAQEGTAPRRVRVYADGIYDLFHQGHARQLLQAKNVFPKCDVYLLVGVTGDALTRSKKGNTVMDENERYEAIRHCRYVDEVVRDGPWTLDEDFLQRHKIDFVAHDEVPYTIGSGQDVYYFIKEKGMFIATHRTEGVSTSDVVARIVRDYDTYIRRNLARGYTRKELNVSFLRGQQIKFATKVDEVKEKFERKKDEYMQKWEDTSKEVIEAFLKLFGQSEWSFEQFWSNSRRRITAALSPPQSPKGSSEDEEVHRGTLDAKKSSSRKRSLSEDGSFRGDNKRAKN